MDVRSPLPGEEEKAATALRRTLLFLSIAIMAVGGGGGPLVARIYFLHGGARLWLSSLLQTVAFPILLMPLSISYIRHRRRGDARIFSLTGRAAAACLGLGLLMALGGYMYGYGSAALPASTSTILISSQLAFTATFAFFLVKQRFTAYSVNAVVLLVIAVVALGLQASGERPDGVSRRRYYLGFATMLGAAVLVGLMTPLVELTRLKMRRKKISYVLVMEMQLIISISSSAFSAMAMLINKDFQAIPREAKAFGLGGTKYYLVLVASSIFWQLMNLGLLGVVFCSSALLASIVATTLLPVGEILPVFLLHEKFNGWKAIAMVLAVWGFVSHLYGEHRENKTRNDQTTVEELQELELPAAP
ncbi:hypothetical protein Taro_024539 [Colocasia esculenta]|uniref:Probable purine permease n=1 Tax=Colocasia esculenta TaxID=4460 RepID=A0A843V0L4_COLES|nr:hypothetical protein [Colocasia esculenta]